MNTKSTEYLPGWVSEEGAYGYSNGTFEFKFRRMWKNQKL
jgi:hypothetical protein